MCRVIVSRSLWEGEREEAAGTWALFRAQNPGIDILRLPLVKSCSSIICLKK